MDLILNPASSGCKHGRGPRWNAGKTGCPRRVLALWHRPSGAVDPGGGGGAGGSAPAEAVDGLHGGEVSSASFPFFLLSSFISFLLPSFVKIHIT